MTLARIVCSRKSAKASFSDGNERWNARPDKLIDAGTIEADQENNHQTHAQAFQNSRRLGTPRKSLSPDFIRRL